MNFRNVALLVALPVFAACSSGGGSSQGPEGIWKLDSINVAENGNSLSVNPSDSFVTIGTYSNGVEFVSVLTLYEPQGCVIGGDVETTNKYTIAVDGSGTFSYDRSGTQMSVVRYNVNGPDATIRLTLMQPYSPQADDNLVERLARTYGFC